MADEPTRPDVPAAAEAGKTVEPAAPAPTTVPAVAAPDLDPGYTASGVPTFESVREKIETRFGTSLGAAELDAESPEGRSIEELYEARQKAAAEKLEEIRASMHKQDNA